MNKKTETDSLNEITQIEEWTQMKTKETIFDSNKTNWKKDSSLFDAIVLSKEKLLFFIETTDGITIGGFMKKKITGTMRSIVDADCFLFTNRNNQLKKYLIKSTNKFDAFQLFSKQDPKLFTLDRKSTRLNSSHTS